MLVRNYVITSPRVALRQQCVQCSCLCMRADTKKKVIHIMHELENRDKYSSLQSNEIDKLARANADCKMILIYKCSEINKAQGIRRCCIREGCSRLVTTSPAIIVIVTSNLWMDLPNTVIDKKKV